MVFFEFRVMTNTNSLMIRLSLARNLLSPGPFLKSFSTERMSEKKTAFSFLGFGSVGILETSTWFLTFSSYR